MYFYVMARRGSIHRAEGWFLACTFVQFLRKGGADPALCRRGVQDEHHIDSLFPAKPVCCIWVIDRFALTCRCRDRCRQVFCRSGPGGKSRDVRSGNLEVTALDHRNLEFGVFYENKSVSARLTRVWGRAGSPSASRSPPSWAAGQAGDPAMEREAHRGAAPGTSGEAVGSASRTRPERRLAARAVGRGLLPRCRSGWHPRPWYARIATR